jgi:signal transduction histidine kinase
MTASAQALARETSSCNLLLDLEGTILRASPVALEELGTTEAEIIGQPLAILLEDTARLSLRRALERARKGKPVSLRVRFREGRAAAAPTQLSLKLKISGPLCGVETDWDAEAAQVSPPAAAEPSADSRQKTFESLLQAYLELQAINKRKMAMLAAATHELKTPLAVINGACELLLGGKLHKLPPAEHEIASLAYQNCQRLLNVVNSFLDYTALEQGRLILRRETRNVAALVQEAAAYWKRLAQSRRIGFSTRVAADVPPLFCDPRKIGNLLDNLCDNALKFTPAGGSVTLSAEAYFWDRRRALSSHGRVERRLACVTEQNAVKFSVADTGPGISPEFHQEIFEQYFQIPGRSSSGMGLGLAIAWEIVAAHKGKIWVDSKPGEGSVFSFLLPLQA